MLKHCVTLVIIAFVLEAGSLGLAEDSWKVTNRGSVTCNVRLRPASNRKVGFAVSETVKSGETKSLPLVHQGSFDINLQFLDKDGSVQSSWTADQPIDLRNRTYPAAGDNLSSYAKQELPRMGPDGKLLMGSVVWGPLMNGMKFKEPTQKLSEVGAVNAQDPKNPKLDFEGGVTVEDKVIKFRGSGMPSSPSIAIDGEPYKITDLVVFRSPEEGRVVLSGTYSGGGRAGEFLLERRDGFPFYRLNLDLKAKGESDWSSFRLGASAVASEVKRGEGVGIDEVRDVTFELQQPLKEAQARVEQRLAAMEARLEGRLVGLELRLDDPKVYRIAKACVDCHQSKQAIKSPQSLPALLPSIPKMTPAMTEDMLQRSELSEEDKARFLEYAKELAKVYGP